MAYATKLRWPVFPCRSGDKRPLVSQGLKDATNEEQIIHSWWERWPDANIGIPTGEISGFDALDVDPRHGGQESLEELVAEHGSLPDTAEQLTGGGGRHILFIHRKGVRNKTGLRPGLDVRGAGGYIVVAPSLHESGRKYEWEVSSRPGEVDLAAWPDWLLGLVRPTNGQIKETAPSVEGPIFEGRRNETLTSLGGTMRQRGMGETTIVAALLVENEQHCKPPLSEDEVRKVAASVVRYKPGQPGNGRVAMKGAAGKNQDSQDDIPTSPYCIRGGRIGYIKVEGRGDTAVEVFVPLCNFNAKVVEEKTLDNGVEVFRWFVVEGKLADGDPLPRAEIKANQFHFMNWVTDQWGVKARLSAGMAAKDRLREAIQVFSQDVQVRHTYAHTGWRKINSVWRYLHIELTDVQVTLEPPLNRYALPVKPEDVKGALRNSLALLDVAPDEVTIPLLAAVYLAPLCEIIHPDFCVFLVGKTGSLKSTLAALFLSHYGVFDRTSLPGSWESTDNALERRLFTLKDVLCIVDDFAPRADIYAQRKQAQCAQRVIRSMGNLSGRSRLTTDLSEQPEYTPRGLMVSTGEDLPPGQSIQARILTIEVEKDRLDMESITQAQEEVHRLRHAMAGYIEWLAPKLDELKQTLPDTWRKHRSLFSQNAAHLRIPEILAHLALGVDLLLSFAREVGVLSEAEIQELAQRTHAALLKLGKTHGQRVREEDPAEIFLSTLSAMLTQGTAKLSHRNASEDLLNMIGWEDDDYIYLIPKAAHQAVSRYIREGGGHFPPSQRALNEALDKQGILVKGPDKRLTPLVKLGGKNRRVLKIPVNFLEPEEEKENAE